MTQEITDQNFKTEVLDSELPVLIDFSASWCGPCKMVAPIIDKLSDEFKDKAKVVKADLDSVAEAAQDFEIRGVPTFIFFSKGKELDRWVGANKSENDFRKKLNEIIQQQ